MTLTVLAYIVGAVILYFFLYLMYKPLRWLAKIVGFAFIGAALLYICNFALGYFGLSVGVNVITATVAGLLGIPGLALLYVLSYIM